MEVCPDGRYEPCNEYTDVRFEKCDRLPDKSATGEYNLDAILSSFNRECETESETTDTISNDESKSEIAEEVSKHDIKARVRNRMTTFKNRNCGANKYTAKKLPVIH